VASKLSYQKCLGYGHIASSCPTKRTMALNLKREVKSEHSFPPSPKSTSSHTSSSSERIKPLEGGLLMIRHQLTQVSKELDPSQRQNIFHSRCHINDKLCPFLIENESGINVASTRVVDKLGLKTIPHAKPYKLSRLKEEDIKVTQQVLINFSIGNFKDEVLCDVVPMEATHILLGRPWQFDRKVFYDGHANPYAFSFQGKKFTLLPLSPNQANEDQNKVKGKIKDEKEKEQVTSKVLLPSKKRFPKQDRHHHSSFSSKAQKEDPMRKHERDDLIKARGNTLIKDGTRAHKREVQILPQIKSSSLYKGLKNLWSNPLQGGEDDEGLTPTKDGGTCLRRLSMFRKEVH